MMNPGLALPISARKLISFPCDQNRPFTPTLHTSSRKGYESSSELYACNSFPWRFLVLYEIVEPERNNSHVSDEKTDSEQYRPQGYATSEKQKQVP